MQPCKNNPSPPAAVGTSGQAPWGSGLRRRAESVLRRSPTGGRPPKLRLRGARSGGSSGKLPKSRPLVPGAIPARAARKMPRGRERGRQPLRSRCPPTPIPIPAPGKRFEEKSVESPTAGGAVPGRPRQSSQTSGRAAPASQLPPPPPATGLGPGPPVTPSCWRLPSSHRAHWGRDGAGAGCSKLPSPAASTLGRPSGSRLGRRCPRRVPGSRPLRADQCPGGQPLAGLRPSGAVDRPRRGGAPVWACGAGPGVEAARCAPRAASSGSDPRQLRCARAPGTREGGAGPPGPRAP